MARLVRTAWAVCSPTQRTGAWCSSCLLRPNQLVCKARERQPLARRPASPLTSSVWTVQAHPSNLTERSNGALYRSDDAGQTWSTPLPIVGNGVGSQFAYSSLSYLPTDAGARRPDRLGLTYETWAEGCEPLSPACAIEFVTLPTTWAQESNMGME